MDIGRGIDAHSHVWTPDLAHYPLAPGYTVGDMRPPSFMAEELLATCRPSGVGRVNLIPMSYYRFDNRDSILMDELPLPAPLVNSTLGRGMIERRERSFRLTPRR